MPTNLTREATAQSIFDAADALKPLAYGNLYRAAQIHFRSLVLDGFAVQEDGLVFLTDAGVEHYGWTFGPAEPEPQPVPVPEPVQPKAAPKPRKPRAPRKPKAQPKAAPKPEPAPQPKAEMVAPPMDTRPPLAGIVTPKGSNDTHSVKTSTVAARLAEQDKRIEALMALLATK